MSFDPFSTLSTEMFYHIVSFLPTNTLLSFSITSKNFRYMINDPHFVWKNHFFTNFKYDTLLPFELDNAWEWRDLCLWKFSLRLRYNKLTDYAVKKSYSLITRAPFNEEMWRVISNGYVTWWGDPNKLKISLSLMCNKPASSIIKNILSLEARRKWDELYFNGRIIHKINGGCQHLDGCDVVHYTYLHGFDLLLLRKIFFFSDNESGGKNILVIEQSIEDIDPWHSPSLPRGIPLPEKFRDLNVYLPDVSADDMLPEGFFKFNLSRVKLNGSGYFIQEYGNECCLTNLIQVQILPNLDKLDQELFVSELVTQRKKSLLALREL